MSCSGGLVTDTAGEKSAEYITCKGSCADANSVKGALSGHGHAP